MKTNTPGPSHFSVLIWAICRLLTAVLVPSTTLYAGALIVDPGGPRNELPTPTLSVIDGRTGRTEGLAFSFDQPGVLQMKTNLASGLWEGIAASPPFIVKNSDLTGDAFFRVLAAERPVVIHVPETYDPSVPTPLIVFLHGYPYSGPWMEDFIGFETTLESLGIISCYPTGAERAQGGFGWIMEPGGIDSTYLRSLIDGVEERLKIDPLRVYLVGHSGGGAMALRMVSDHADKIAAIVSLAGNLSYCSPVTWSPSEPVNVLHIHGIADQNVDYSWEIGTLDQWANLVGCGDKTPELERTLNLVDDAELDSSVTRFTECPSGGVTELWTIETGGSHFPVLSEDFQNEVISWLLAHPKP